MKVAVDVASVLALAHPLHKRVGASCELVGNGTDGLIVDSAFVSQPGVEGRELQVALAGVLGGEIEVLLEDSGSGLSDSLARVVTLAGGLVAGDQLDLAAVASHVREAVDGPSLTEHSCSDDRPDIR